MVLEELNMGITTTIDKKQLILRNKIEWNKADFTDQVIEVFFHSEEQLKDVFESKNLDKPEGLEQLWNQCILSMDTTKFLRKFKTKRWYMQYTEINWVDNPLIPIERENIILYTENTKTDEYREKQMVMIIDPLTVIDDIVLRKSIGQFFKFNPLDVFIDHYNLYQYYQDQTYSVLFVVFSIINQKD